MKILVGVFNKKKTPGGGLPWILRHLLRSLVDSSTPHCCVLQCAAAGEITYQLINHSHCRLVKFSISRQSNPVKWMIDPPGRRGSPDTTLQIHTEESYRSDSPEFSELQPASTSPHSVFSVVFLPLECCATLRLAGGWWAVTRAEFASYICKSAAYLRFSPHGVNVRWGEADTAAASSSQQPPG